MKQKIFHFTIVFLQCLGVLAQVGINTTTPDATLDVNGDVLVQNKLYLEDPGSFVSGPDSKLLMINNAGNIIKYDIKNSDFGPLNYVHYIFENTKNTGLTGDYDTRIDPAKYTLAVHGYYYLVTDTNPPNTNALLKSSNGPNVVEGQQFYAYIGGKGTNKNPYSWRIRGFVNNSYFRLPGDDSINIDLFMDVIIYRNDFITKVVELQEVNMEKLDSQLVPLPAVFQ